MGWLVDPGGVGQVDDLRVPVASEAFGVSCPGGGEGRSSVGADGHCRAHFHARVSARTQPDRDLPSWRCSVNFAGQSGPVSPD